MGGPEAEDLQRIEEAMGAAFDDDRAEEALRVLLPDDQLRFFTFFFLLPDQVPFGHKSTLAVQTSSDLGPAWDLSAPMTGENTVTEQPVSVRSALVSLRFWQAKVKQPTIPDAEPVFRVLFALLPPTVEQPPPPTNEQDSYVTVVEAVTQAGLAHGERAPNLIAACFERTLEAVNRVIDAYAVAHNDAQVTRVSSQHLGMMSVVLSRPIGTAEFDVSPVMYLLPYRPRGSKDLLDYAGMDLVSRFVIAELRGQPFIASERFYHQATDAIYRGDYDTAVLWATTSGELLLNNLLMCALVESGDDEQAKDTFALIPGLKARLKRRYAPLLGGRWNPDDPSTELGAWWRDVEEVRGRILHGGYHASAQQAHDAMQAAEALDRFVDSRLAERRMKFPRTVLSKLGIDGLKERKVYSRRMERIAAAEGPSLPDFWAQVRSVLNEAATRPARREHRNRGMFSRVIRALTGMRPAPRNPQQR